MWQYAVNKDLDVPLFAAAAAAAVADRSAQHAVPPPAYRVSSPSAVKSALVVSSAPPTRTAARRHMLPPEIFLANIIRKSFVSNVYLMLNVALSTIYTSYVLSKSVSKVDTGLALRAHTQPRQCSSLCDWFGTFATLYQRVYTIQTWNL